MPSQPRYRSLYALTLAVADTTRFISDPHHHLSFDGLYCLQRLFSSMHNQTVLVAVTSQYDAVRAMIGLDGLAKRVLLLTPDGFSHIPWIVEHDVDVVLDDERMQALTADRFTRAEIPTEWVLFTSGTTGRPKMVLHTLASLSGPLNDGVAVPDRAVWSTFYDIRRYGGLQILLRALIGGGSMVLSSEPMHEFLERAADEGVTRISGTPSHWRRALQTAEIDGLRPEYVRMSGEIADQTILDRVAERFPNASVAHAFASTEAGVVFDVRDGKAGFPASFIPFPNDNPSIEIKVQDDTLRVRSSRTSSGYLADAAFPKDDDGFVDTNDLVELQDDRYYFQGRREGIINIAGIKVFPEEVEHVLSTHPDLRMVRVRGQPNRITGSMIVADIVTIKPMLSDEFMVFVQNSLRQFCLDNLPRYKRPTVFLQVDSISLTSSGKVKRGGE